MFISKILFYISWLVKFKLLNKKIPLNSSIILTDKCNLQCKHCTVSNLGYTDTRFTEIKKDIDRLYSMGSRMLVITGGEPFLWQDNNYVLDDVVEYAKRIGFYRIVICTNGTFELKSKADYLWVSLDGFPQEHDRLRGNIYNTVIQNISDSNHKKIYINFTIHKDNFLDFDVSTEQILTIKKVRGILFHIFTPYLNSDKSLVLTDTEKQLVINKLFSVKKNHPIKVSNTYDGIKALKENIWERPLWGSITINQGEPSLCCCRKGIYNDRVCSQCGCSPAAETWVLQQLKPLAIIENLRFL